MKKDFKKYLKVIVFVCVGLAVFGVKLLLDGSREPVLIVKSESEESSVATLMETTSSATESLPEVVVPVFFSGAVVSPGVYEIRENQYLYEALDEAGGLADSAAEEYIHMVYQILNPISVYIPTYVEVEDFLRNPQSDSGLMEIGIQQGILRVGEFVPVGSDSQIQDGAGIVNINTADAKTLQQLPGIGESTATAIVRYRETNGDFTTIEDIMKVAGIKQGRFDALKEFISV